MIGQIVPLAERHLAAVGRPSTPRTIRGYAHEDGEVVYSVFGWYPDDTRFVVFAEIGPEARKQARTYEGKRHFAAALHGVRQMLTEIPAGAPIHAQADPQHEGSATLLEHLGFERLEGDVFELKGVR